MTDTTALASYGPDNRGPIKLTSTKGWDSHPSIEAAINAQAEMRIMWENRNGDMKERTTKWFNEKKEGGFQFKPTTADEMMGKKPRYSRKAWRMKKEIERTMANGEVRLTMTESINEFNQREPE